MASLKIVAIGAERIIQKEFLICWRLTHKQALAREWGEVDTTLHLAGKLWGPLVLKRL